MALLSTPNTGIYLTVRRLDLMRFDWYKMASLASVFYLIKHPKISSPEAFLGQRIELELTGTLSASLLTLKKNKIMVKTELLLHTHFFSKVPKDWTRKNYEGRYHTRVKTLIPGWNDFLLDSLYIINHFQFKVKTDAKSLSVEDKLRCFLVISSLWSCWLNWTKHQKTDFLCFFPGLSSLLLLSSFFLWDWRIPDRMRQLWRSSLFKFCQKKTVKNLV